MGLKEIPENYRIFFLWKFTENILLNLSEKTRLKNKIEAEKLKQKFLASSSFHENVPENFVKESQKKFRENIPEKKVLFPHPRVPLKKPPEKKEVKPILPSSIETRVPAPFQGIYMGSDIKGEGMKKIDFLLKDSAVISIECPGPGKNLLVRKFNKINITRIILGENEIKDIINHFAEKAKIPVEEGILKIAVDNFLISAVISEFVGSRFIINKMKNSYF